ncbi:uncharacterized protein LOC132263587 [Phlebotomus argentipes]|uniref:uncharacterized protein LOC132263587 n=1 Tax=Phlebotomus argentipes TaxID=94469 RepID=UPI00289298B2|nr:uncharacterized protein LOC132263587 [Phlebotomus argentipes]
MRCIVKDCENSLKNCPPGVTFHRFPQDVRLSRKWKILIDVGPNYMCKEKDRVCSDHFLEENFEYRRFRDKFKKYLRTNSTPQPLFDMHLDEYRMQMLENEELYPYVEENFVTEPMPEPPIAVGMGNGQMYAQQSNQQHTSRNIYAAGSSSQGFASNAPKRSLPFTDPAALPKKLRPSNSHTITQSMMQPVDETTALNVECEIELEKVKIESLSELLSELKEKNYISEDIAEVLKDTIGFNEDLFDDSIKILDFKEIPESFQPVMKDFALTLDFYAPKAYRYILSEYKSFLPSPRDFAAWYRSSEADPGFTQECLDTISELVKSEAEQGLNVLCQLTFDEKEIWPQVQKIGDKTYGYCTTTTADKPSNDVATKVLLFMLVDMNGAWKMPIGYFPMTHLSCDMRQNLIEKAIINAEDTGAKIMGVTFKGDHVNFSTMKLMGASFAMDEPVFNIRIGDSGKRYFIYPDPFDMIQRVKNTFVFEKYILDGEGNIVDYSYIEQLLQLFDEWEPNSSSSSSYFHRKKVNMHIASHLLNKAIADALDHFRASSNQTFGGCEATGRFIRMMSNIYDMLKNNQQANGETSNTMLIGNLKRIKSFCDNAQKYLFDLCLLSNVQASSEADEIRYTFSEKESLICSAKKAGFLGLLICLENLPKICAKAKPDIDSHGLKTYFLNQDSVEQFYCSVRTNLSSNTSPSILQFRDAYRKLITCAQIIRDNKGTCIAGTESVKVLFVNPARCLQVINGVRTASVFETIKYSFKDEGEYEDVITKHFRTHDEILDEEDFKDISFKLGEIERENSSAGSTSATCRKMLVIYTTGLLVKKLLTKSKCQDCSAIIVDDSEGNANANLFERYGFFYPPSKFVVDVCELTEEILQGEIQYLGINFIYENRHENEMISQVTKHFDYECLHFTLSKCHKYSMIELISGLFLKVRIFHELNKKSDEADMKNVYKILVHFEEL